LKLSVNISQQYLGTSKYTSGEVQHTEFTKDDDQQELLFPASTHLNNDVTTRHSILTERQSDQTSSQFNRLTTENSGSGTTTGELAMARRVMASVTENESTPKIETVVLALSLMAICTMLIFGVVHLCRRSRPGTQVKTGKNMFYHTK